MRSCFDGTNQERPRQPRRRARARGRTRGLGGPALVRNTRHCGRAGAVACTDTPGPARNRRVADRRRKPAAALGRFRGHRGRHRGCGRRAGRDARDGRGVRSDAQHHRQRRQCDRPARRIAVRDELDHHPRPDTADRRPRRHRPRQGRPAAGVAGTVASGEHGDQGRWYGCQRAVARRRPERLGAAPAGQGDRRAQVQSRHARAGGRPGREATVRRSRGRQSGRARQQPLDGGRHFRVRRLARLGVVGGQRDRCQHLPPYRVPVGDGKARRQGRIRAAQGRDGGRSRVSSWMSTPRSTTTPGSPRTSLNS